MKKKKIPHFIIALFYLLLSSCSSQLTENVNEVLELSGDNRTELEAVIGHYKNDKQKLQAAYFLIGHMKNKYANNWDNWKDYNELFTYLDSIKDHPELLQLAEKKFNEIKQHKGLVVNRVYDMHCITRKMLIDNIDYAFKAWEEFPWGKNFDFDQFCEYILPYRSMHEPLDNWRPYYYKEMKWVLDSVENKKDIKQVSKYLNDYINHRHNLLITLKEMPKLPNIAALTRLSGTCEHRYPILMGLFKTFGIPAAIDRAPVFTNWPELHPWLVVFDNSYKPFAFSGGEDIKYTETNQIPMGWGQWIATKVYRKTFAYDQSFYTDPAISVMHTDPCIDVTSEYDMPQGEISFKFNGPQNELYLCAFEQQEFILPVDRTVVKNGKAVFQHVGSYGMYVPAIFTSGNFIPVQQPFFVDSLNQINPYSFDINQRETVRLTRKYPIKQNILDIGNEILNTRFEASNSPLFKESKTLYEITEIPQYFTKVPIEEMQPYRYIRMVLPNVDLYRLNELEFYQNNNKLDFSIQIENLDQNTWVDALELEKLFDGDVSTSMNLPGNIQIVFDFIRPVNLTAIKYIYPTHLNYVEIGNEYQLEYYNNLTWNKIERKVAENNFIEFHNVPKGALLLLRNLTKGKNERCFFYNNGKQVFL